MYRVDIRPYRVKVVTDGQEVDDYFDVRQSLSEFLWAHVHEGKWTAGVATEAEVITQRLEGLPLNATSLDVTDREYDLIMEAHRATQGPQRVLMPFLRRLSSAEHISMDERGRIIC